MNGPRKPTFTSAAIVVGLILFSTAQVFATLRIKKA
jgi:hypothetical protein